MTTTTYSPETGWIAVRLAELAAAAEHWRARVGRRPRTLNRRSAQALDWLRVWTPNLNRTEQAR